ncbi:MAG: class I SAM-dependent methyltransferase [Acidobacteriota bacterium]|nr:class I SAM-dependent methyltransferase [Acidobacteriota bacterium]
MVTEPRAGWPDRSAGSPPVWMDPSFSELLHQHPVLGTIRRYLPPSSASVFAGRDEIETLPSSYADRGYGLLFYALVRALMPKSCVEIGLFRGYSLLMAAAALRDNGAGAITGYDLFEDYPYRHAQRAQVAQQIVDSGLAAWATLRQADVHAVHEHWGAVDYLHVDVSNTGETYRAVFEHWAPKVSQVILLEGGSRERDNVDWMLQYGKPAIVPALADLRRDYPEWSISVLEPFPSLTVALKTPAVADRAAS